MLKMLKVGIGCTVSRSLTWPFTKKSDGKELVTIGLVDGCSVLLENQFVGTHRHVDITWVLSVVFRCQIGAAGERPEFDIKLPFGLHS